MAHTPSSLESDFIRIFFRDPIEEEVAFRWASRLSRLVGPLVHDLRPDTTLATLLNWGAVSQPESIDFLVVFEPESRLELRRFLNDCERTTFREMVEAYAAIYLTTPGSDDS